MTRAAETVPGFFQEVSFYLLMPVFTPIMLYTRGKTVTIGGVVVKG